MSKQRRYVALICGGRGDNTWDIERTFWAPNLVTAAALAHAAAVETGPTDSAETCVVSVEECE